MEVVVVGDVIVVVAVLVVGIVGDPDPESSWCSVAVFVGVDLEWLNVFETEAAAEAKAAENLSMAVLSPRVNRWRGLRDRGWMASSEVISVGLMTTDQIGGMLKIWDNIKHELLEKDFIVKAVQGL